VEEALDHPISAYHASATIKDPQRSYKSVSVQNQVPKALLLTRTDRKHGSQHLAATIMRLEPHRDRQAVSIDSPDQGPFWHSVAARIARPKGTRVDAWFVGSLILNAVVAKIVYPLTGRRAIPHDDDRRTTTASGLEQFNIRRTCPV